MEAVSLPAWRRLAAFMATRSYGDSISHEALSVVLGCDYPSHEYYAGVRRAIDEVARVKNYQWETVTGGGYRLAYPHEVHRIAANRVGRGKREILKARDVYKFTDRAALPTPLQAKHAQAEDGLDAVCRLLDVAEQQSRQLGREPLREMQKLRVEAERQIEYWKREAKAAFKARDKAQRAMRQSAHAQPACP